MIGILYLAHSYVYLMVGVVDQAWKEKAVDLVWSRSFDRVHINETIYCLGSSRLE